MTQIDRNSYVPLTKQLEEIISERIVSGQYKVSQKIPSQEMFVDEFHVSRITVRQCMTNLIAKGILESFKGKGTFIKGVPPKSNDYHTSTGLTAQFKSNRQQLETIIISKQKINSNNLINRILQIKNNNSIYQIERVRKIDHKSFSYEVNYLNSQIIDNDEFLSFLIDNSSLYNTLYQLSGIEIDYAEETIIPIISDQSIESLIDVEPHTPLLKVQRITFAKGIDTPFEYTEYVIKAEYYGTITYRNIK